MDDHTTSWHKWWRRYSDTKQTWFMIQPLGRFARPGFHEDRLRESSLTSNGLILSRVWTFHSCIVLMPHKRWGLPTRQTTATHRVKGNLTTRTSVLILRGAWRIDDSPASQVVQVVQGCSNTACPKKAFTSVAVSLGLLQISIEKMASQYFITLFVPIQNRIPSGTLSHSYWTGHL